MTDHVFILGMVASAFTSLCYLPQVIRLYKTKSSDDVSTTTIIQCLIGNALWEGYGALLGDIPLMTSSILAMIILSVAYILHGIYATKKPWWYRLMTRICEIKEDEIDIKLFLMGLSLVFLGIFGVFLQIKVGDMAFLGFLGKIYVGSFIFGCIAMMLSLLVEEKR